MDRATLVDDVTRVGDGLDGRAVGGLAVLDVERLGLRGQEADLAADDDQVVCGSGTVLVHMVSSRKFGRLDSSNPFLQREVNIPGHLRCWGRCRGSTCSSRRGERCQYQGPRQEESHR
jgi:hypothetical protein